MSHKPLPDWEPTPPTPEAAQVMADGAALMRRAAEVQRCVAQNVAAAEAEEES